MVPGRKVFRLGGRDSMDREIEEALDVLQEKFSDEAVPQVIYDPQRKVLIVIASGQQTEARERAIQALKPRASVGWLVPKPRPGRTKPPLS
jgi:hypothetical protein